MASKYSLLFLGLFFLATTSLSHGFLLDGLLIAQVKVNGTIYCSSTGNLDLTLTTCPPLANVKVTLTTTGLLGTSVVAQAVTDANGVFELVYDTLGLLQFLPTNYLVSVDLAANVGLPCNLLPVTGILQAPFTILGTVTGLLGNVAFYTIGLLHVV